MKLGSLWWTNVLNSALPPQRLRPDTQLEHQDPVSHMAFVEFLQGLLVEACLPVVIVQLGGCRLVFSANQLGKLADSLLHTLAARSWRLPACRPEARLF